MKTTATLVRELLTELHFWQMMARLDAQSLARTRTRCKQIGARLRKLQAKRLEEKTLKS